MKSPNQQIQIQDQKENWRDNQFKTFLVRTFLSQIALVTSASSTHPFDTVKIRLQKEGEMLSAEQQKNKKYKNILRGLLVIFQEEGIRGIYKGLSMAVVRELSYGTLRTGLYEPYKDLLQRNDLFKQNQNMTKLCAGLLSGTTGAVIANPADVQQAHYNIHVTVMQEVKAVFQREGIQGFWKGTIPNVLRGSVVTATQLGTYDITKQAIKTHLHMKEGFSLFATCAFVAGLALTLTACPFDLIKTRMMSANINKLHQYNGVLDCVWQTYKNEGFFAFYKGFGPQWSRFGTLSCIYFITWETLRKKVGIQTI